MANTDPRPAAIEEAEPVNGTTVGVVVPLEAAVLEAEAVVVRVEAEEDLAGALVE